MKTTGNPVLSAIVSSARFAGRRAAARFCIDPKIETLLVDVDRTITREDSPKLALEHLCGKKEAKRVFDSILQSAALGRIPLESVNSAVFSELYKNGFKRSDWAALMERQDRSGGLRMDLIGAITELAAKENVTLVLATRSSRDSAQWLAGRFGIPFSVGSVERPMNGSFAGFSTMIGVVDGIVDGTEMLTKMTAASRLLAASGLRLDPIRTAVLTNDLLDAFEMLACARGVLLVPKEKNTLEKLTSGFRLYDALIHEDGDVRKQLNMALGFEKD
jgi:hypothetical protein